MHGIAIAGVAICLPETDVREGRKDITAFADRGVSDNLPASHGHGARLPQRRVGWGGVLDNRYYGAGWLLELSCHDPVAHNAAAEISSTTVSIKKVLRFSETPFWFRGFPVPSV
jgi:hypothetical protein